MAYGDTPAKREGIRREPEIADNVVKYLRYKGYIVDAIKTDFDKDTKQKIDYYLIFDPKTPFMGKTKIAIDPKARRSYTKIDRFGNDNLEASKSDYLIKNVKGSDEYFWVEVNRLREVVKIHPPNLQSKNDPSQFFWLEEYVEEYADFFKGYTIFKYKYRAG
jgi:hypothetical protein